VEGAIVNIYFENFLKAVRHQEPFQVPVAIFNLAPFTTSFTGTDVKSYYMDPALKMKAQLKLNEMLPEIIMIPALWADFGPVVECSAFGGEILWFEDQPPFLKRAIDTYEEINRIKPINPEKDGLMPLALDQYRYMWDHIDPRKVDEYGCLDGVAVTMGPIETAGLLIDFQNFFLGIYDAPDQIKKLIEIVTDSILLWIQAQEKVNGRLKQLILLILQRHIYFECFRPGDCLLPV
jgi:uroporphyrinogen-III decarboxylase